MPDMPHLPEQRQRVAPPLAVIAALVVVLVVAGIAALAVGLSIGWGGEDCPATNEKGAVSNNCR